MGDRLLIVGAGCVGQAAAQIAAAMGARATLCDVDPQRLAVARQIGAAETVLDVAGTAGNATSATASFAWCSTSPASPAWRRS